MKHLVTIVVLIMGSFCLMAPSYENDFDRVSSAIQTLTPSVHSTRADRLSVWILGAAQEFEFDPILVTAMVRRESNFRQDVENGTLLGKRGEIGLMQNHGISLRYRPQWCPKTLLIYHRDGETVHVDESAHCQIYTGASFLAWVRDHCGGSKSRWVASYGMSRCATEEEAPDKISVKRARRFYFAAGGTEWD